MHQRQPRWPNSVIRSTSLHFMIRRAVHTALLRRVESMPLRIIRVMATVCTVCSTTQLRVEIFVLAKVMFIDSLKCLSTSLIRWSPKGFLLLVNTAACWIIALSVERRSVVLSTLAARQASSCCWALISNWRARLVLEMCGCLTALNLSML